MFRVAFLWLAVSVAAAAHPATAATSGAPISAAAWPHSDEPYGYILNTDGGTFDGVALRAAVRDSLEAALLTDATLARVVSIESDSHQ